MKHPSKLKYVQSHQSFLLYSLLPCLCLLSGCASKPAISGSSGYNAPVYQSPSYQQSTSGLSPEQIQQKFKTIEGLIQSGKGALAKKSVDELDKQALSPEEANQLNLLYSQIMLSFGEAEQAIDTLNKLQPEQLNTSDKIKYYQALSFGHSLAGNLLESAKARITLNALLTDQQQYNKNQAAILETLKLLPTAELQNAYQTQTDIDLAGWMTLASVLKLKGQANGNFNAELAKWRETYPGHSGNSAILAMETPTKTAQKPVEHNFMQPNTIALFLPETGPFAQAGKAIRAGFMLAYNSPSNIANKPSYRFYNSEQPALSSVYNQAISDGADLVIGPLSKESIQNLASTTNLTIPVLALNHVPSLQKENLFQFGLSPMDDVAEITSKAAQDGLKKALVLVPNNEQGSRIASYFAEDWQRLDGSIIDSQTYNPKESDFSSVVKKLLNINESEFRYRKLAEIVPNIVFSARRRNDVDVIFLSAHSDQARLINPQLQFFHAAAVPVYAMPNVYTGLANPGLDADLNKITFCDTPWVFDNVYPGELSMNSTRETWQTYPNSYLRLIAMGIDAYQLASRLNTRDIDGLPGATGKLTLTPDNRIKRQLTCAKFNNGQPSVIAGQSVPPSN
jgi:hypothetical protein